MLNNLNRTVEWSAQAECTLLHKRIERQADRIDAFERAAGDIAANTAFICDRLERLERANNLPAGPTSTVAPDPAPETPEQTAMRLLGDPEALAGVICEVAMRSYAKDRQALHDGIVKLDSQSHARAAGLRLLAAAIAAGSFS